MQNHMKSRSQTVESKSCCMCLAVGCRLKSHLCLSRCISHLVSWSLFVFGEAAFQLVHSIASSMTFCEGGISSDKGPFGFINFLFAKKALRLIAKTSQNI